MFRVILSLILVANLVACPLRCTFSQVSGQRGEIRAQEIGGDQVCPCCPAERELQPTLKDPAPENTTRDQGNPPCDDCDCQNCICEGATLSNATELPAGDQTLVDWIHGDLNAQKIANLFDRAANAPFSDRVPSTNSASDMRVAHQCWLI